jgi:hypothetical protein
MVTGDDKSLVVRTAEELARSFWAYRFAFGFVAPTASLADCLDSALKSKQHPFHQ